MKKVIIYIILLISLNASAQQGVNRAFGGTVDSVGVLYYGPGYPGLIVTALGFYARNTPGNGNFVWDATSTATEVPGQVIKPLGVTTGRWRRVLINNTLNVIDFGAKGDFSFDNTTVLQAMYDYAFTLASPKIINPTGRYKFSKIYIGPSGTNADASTTGIIIEGQGIRNSQSSAGGGTGYYSTLAAGNGAAINFRPTIAKGLIMKDMSIESLSGADTLVQMLDTKHNGIEFSNVDFSAGGGKVAWAQNRGANQNGEFTRFNACKFRQFTDCGVFWDANQSLHPKFINPHFEQLNGSACFYFKSNCGATIIEPTSTVFAGGDNTKPNIYMRIGGSQYDANTSIGGRLEGIDQLLIYESDAQNLMVNIYGMTVTLNQNLTTYYPFIEYNSTTTNNVYGMNIMLRDMDVVISSLTNRRPLIINAMYARAATLVADNVKMTNCYPVVNMAMDNANDYNIASQDNLNRSYVRFTNSHIRYTGSGSSSSRLNDFDFNRTWQAGKITGEEDPVRKSGTPQNFLYPSKYTTSNGNNIAASSPWVHYGTSSTFGNANDFSAGNAAQNTISPYGKIIRINAGSGVYNPVVNLSADTLQHMYTYKALVSVRENSIMKFYLKNTSTGFVYDSVNILGEQTSKSQWAKTLITLTCYEPRNESGQLAIYQESVGGNTLAIYWQMLSEKFDAVFAPTTSGPASDSLSYDVITQSGNFRSMLKIPVVPNSFIQSAPGGIGGMALDKDSLTLRLNDGSFIQEFPRTFRANTYPTSGGPYTKGAIVSNVDPGANGILGWVCTVPGSPGTWIPININSVVSQATSSTFVGSGGETSATISGIVHNMPFLAFISGISYEIITSGTPNDAQVKVDTATGSVTWSQPLPSPSGGISPTVKLAYNSLSGTIGGLGYSIMHVSSSSVAQTLATGSTPILFIIDNATYNTNQPTLGWWDGTNFQWIASTPQTLP